MRRLLNQLCLAIVCAGCVLSASAAQTSSDSTGLDKVLAQMDAAAKNFKPIEAKVEWDQYDKVINETEIQKGKIYFRRENGGVQMALDLVDPDQKFVLYAGGKVQIYQPKIDQVTEYNAGKNVGDVESFLVLGFGGSGHDLYKSYDVKFLGPETVNNVATSRLELTPKSVRVRSNIAKVVLWIDLRGISVQQQFFEPSGNYRLVKYSEIQENPKLPDSDFKLKTTKKTKFLSPQG
ncbi:MAG: outer membrane lipoprotein carrier protein LolA [Terriglobales bacterium]|jgi:outer membrane lipoprotein-sorting protein